MALSSLEIGQNEAKIIAQNFNLFYGDFQALKDINVAMAKNSITAIIGPSGCGK